MNTLLVTINKYLNNIYFVSIFSFTSIIYFFTWIFFGLDFTDTFYHINQAQIPSDGVILYPIFLSSLIIKGIIGIVGPQLIYLRVINAFLFFISVFIPFILIKTAASTTRKLFYIGCIFFLIAPLNANILGYDSFSIVINSIIFSVTVVYINKKNFYLLVVLAFLCSTSILIRLPNALVLPILMFGIFYREKLLSSKFILSQIKLPFLLLFLALFGVLISYFLYYKNWDVFLSASLGTISHDLKRLLYRYFNDGIKLLMFCSFIIGSLVLFQYLKDKRGHFFAYGVNFFLYTLFIVLFLFSGYSYTIFLTSIALSITVITLFSKPRKNNLLILIMFVSFLFINAFGSNQGLLKTSFLFLLLPFVLCLINLRSDNFWKSILIILIPFAVVGKFYRTYEDGHIFSLNKTLKNSLLHPIRTSEERFRYLQEIDNKVNQLRSENVSIFFYGNKSHIFHYLYPETFLDIKAFTQPVENLIFLPHIESKVRDKPKVAVFLINSYPESTETTENIIEEELVKKGFKKLQQGSLEFLIKR